MPDIPGDEQMKVILQRVLSRFGTLNEALAWYHSEPLPGFSDKTAAELAAQGRAGDILEYLDAVDAGIHS